MSAGRICTAILALVAVCNTAPHKRISFHEHIEDFIGLILGKSGLQLELLLTQYGESKEMGYTVTYLKSTQFKNLFYEMQALPEFKTAIEYLDSAHIDARLILERINELVDTNENVELKHKQIKNSELTLNSFMRESVEFFPKEDLAQLFNDKMQKYPSFRDSINKLQSKEWERILTSLWSNEKFKQSVKTLEDKGIDLRLLILQIKAVFGQS